MRFAEYKTRLFIFFAGRLLRWAKSIELEMTNGQSPPAILVDDSNVRFAEPSRESEAVSAPPEHWTRLVANSPPQHWLDLVRDKAPQLLPPSESLLPAAQAEEESFRQQEKAEDHQEANFRPAGAGERPGPRPLLPTKQGRRETRYSSAKAKRSTWLDRLRFQPPGRRARSADPTYVSNSRTRDSDSFLAAGGAVENGSESSLRQPTLNTGDAGAWSPESETNSTIPARRITSRPAGNLSSNPEHNNKIDAQQKINQLDGSLSLDPKPENKLYGRQIVARSDSNLVSREARTKHPDRQPGTGYEQGRSDHSESARRETSYNEDLRHSMLEPGKPETVKPETVRNTLHLNRSNISLERSAQAAASNRGPSKNESIGDQLVESSSAKRGTPLKELDRMRGANLERRERPGSSADAQHLRTLDQPAAEPNRGQSRIKREARQVHDIGTPTRTRNSSAAPILATMAMNSRVRKQPPSPDPLFNVVTRTEQGAGREFAPVPPAERTSIETNMLSNEGLWPLLPPSPKFDVADELAAKEQEAEALRRLELEQRGTLWNA